MGTYNIDGVFVPAEQAVLPVSDLAVLRGYGVFDFLRTYGGKPFYLDAHIRRLQNSARLVGLACPWSFQEICDRVSQTLARNDYQEANIRLLITGGDSDDSITPGEKPRLLIMVTPLKTFPHQWYVDGVKIITVDLTRYLPGAKSIDYIRAIACLQTARQTGAIESVYVDARGRVLEGTTSNIFAVIGSKLVTPAAGILPGVTRDVILDLVVPTFQPELHDLTREELYRAEEVFITSSNKEILPVRQVDDRVIGGGLPGAATRRIMELFRQHAEQGGA